MTSFIQKNGQNSYLFCKANMFRQKKTKNYIKESFTEDVLINIIKI